MRVMIFPRGSLVSITSYGPYFGCTGIIRCVEVIEADAPKPVPFYLVALREGLMREPLWFEHDALAEVVGDAISFSAQRREA